MVGITRSKVIYLYFILIISLIFNKIKKYRPCSPPVRWGLLDFMSVSSPPPSRPRPSPSPSPPHISLSDLNYDLVSSVWRAGPQPRARELSVACRTPTGSPWVECGVPDPNRETVCWVWRAGPQLRSREFSVACRTPTAIMRVQRGVPDLNRELVSSVWRAGPQLRSKGLVVLAERVCQRSSCKMSQDKSERMSEDMSARSSERMCQKEWSKICQECQKICLKEVQRGMSETCSKICQLDCQPEVGRTWSSGGHNKYDVWKHDAVPQHAGTSRRRLGSR